MHEDENFLMITNSGAYTSEEGYIYDDLTNPEEHDDYDYDYDYDDDY